MELKFRWYDKSSNEMINSVEVHNGEHTDCYIISTNGRLELYASIEGEGFGGCDELVSRDAMQFTGLTDKNGKDIFAGDIIQYPGANEVANVAFVNGAFVVLPVMTDEPELVSRACGCGEYEGLAVIIGNIHQHSHLLDKGE